MSESNGHETPRRLKVRNLQRHRGRILTLMKHLALARFQGLTFKADGLEQRLNRTARTFLENWFEFEFGVPLVQVDVIERSGDN